MSDDSTITGAGESVKPCVPDCSSAEHLDYLSEVVRQCARSEGVKADALGAIEAVRAALAKRGAGR